MAVFKCKMCGGALDIQEGSSVAVCSFCGTKQTVPKLDNETRINLYDRANHFRRNNDYDKAMLIYEQLLEADKTDAEAYWSILLCKYGVEYVEDPQTHKMMPTINRAQYTSIFADEDYKSAIQYADGYQREVYENEAKELDKIQKGILAISQKEDPFDIFICYKETDVYGRRTQDSVLAQDLYYQLTKEGFKVFFSRITLEDKLGTAYEPYIFAALNTAKIMVVIGTSKENLNSVWVKNEWSRFLALTKKDNSKVLIPAYRDMDPYDLPEEFSHLQAQDMSKLGFMQDLIRGIKKILAKDEKVVVVSQNGLPSQSANVEALLKRAYIACEDGDFAKADNFAEQILNINPEFAEAYVIKLLAECKVRKLDDLKLFGENINAKTNFKRAFRYAKADTKAQLETIGKENNDHVQKYPIYCKAQGLIKQEQYNAAIDCLSKIADYKDSNELIDILKQKIVEQKKARIYTNAVSSGFCMGQSENLINKSIEALKSLGDYKDCEEQIQKLYKRLDDLRYQKQIEAEEAKQRAIKRKHNRKVCFIMSSISAVVLMVVLLITFLAIIPLSEIKKADSMVLSGDLEEALSVYSELNGFGDSEIRIAKINAVLNAREHFAEKNTNEGINDIFAQDGTIQVTYVCNGGSIIKSQNNDTITRQLLKGYALAVPTKAGYSFEKWELSEYCVGFDLQNITAELRLEAVWSECAYSISYDLDGGTVATTNPTSYKYESEDIVIQNPTKTGYTFIGWSGEDIEEPTTELIIRQGSQGDRSFIANWQANTYKITFNTEGGIIDKTETDINYNDWIKLPIPEKKGYRFSGWFFNGEKLNDGNWNIAQDCTLDARWDLIVYSIKYILDGGENAENNPSSYSAYDEITIQEPSKTGYTFLGWTYDGVTNPIKSITIQIGSIGEREFVANWLANTYLITYNYNGGVESVITQNVTFDSFSCLATATRSGYKFCGWFENEMQYVDGVWETPRNITLCAKWIPDTNTKYKVNHYQENANDTGYTLFATETLYGTTDSTVTPSVNEYACFTSPSLKSIIISGDGTSEVNYYYKRNKYTLTLYPNNGESAITKTFKYQATLIGIDSWVSQTGYTFGGWYIDEDLTTAFSYTNMGNSSVSLYAYWAGDTKPTKLAYEVVSSEIKINGALASLSQIAIPSHIGNIPVTTISNLSSSAIESVRLPWTTTTICDNAFAGAANLTTINLNNIEYIGESAFSECTSLQDITFDRLVSLGDYAFKGCISLKNIILPNTLTGALNYCFYNCSSMENIVISQNVTEICKGSFYGCGGLKEMTIPFTGISPIGNASNYYVNNSFGSIFGETEYGGSAPIGYDPGAFCKTFYVPKSLTKVTVYGDIQNYAFSNCQYLTTVIVVNAKKIGEKAFNSCVNLTSLQMCTLVLETINSGAFVRCDRLLELYVPRTIKTIWSSVFYCLGSGEDTPKIDLYYEGSEEDWNAINKAPFDSSDTQWDYGREIEIHFNCDSPYR
ncbi:MAG: InlB B-repeat-containing protein [Paludibacteraceae bacterium]